MNEQLKFSWGHIIAFLAIIFISYTTFVGLAYSSDGNFIKPAIITLIIDIILLIFFIGSQMAKATVRKFSKIIWVERGFVFLSPVVLLLAMIPSFHFWAVHSKEKEVVEQFSKAITASKQMFQDYEGYSDKRIKSYEEMLTAVIADKEVNMSDYKDLGFMGKASEQSHKENMVNTLRLQLLSSNYETLKKEAIKWIDESNHGASTWNVFLLGNTKEIKEAIHSWFNQLVAFSEPKLSTEDFRSNSVKAFGLESKSLQTVDEGIDNLTKLFQKASTPPIWSFLLVFILYAALIFPYILQDRHTKSEYRLIGMRKKSVPQIDMNQDGSSTYKGSSRGHSNNVSQDADDDYASFKM